MDYWRQTDIVSAQGLAQTRVVIIGLGGIGSPTAYCLAKMGVRDLRLFDDDKVELHNLNSTMFHVDQIGSGKAQAAARLTEMASDEANPTIYPFRITEDETAIPGGIVISGVDSMLSRERIWKHLKIQKPQLYVDGRMAGQYCRILTVNPTIPSQVDFYESTLFKDSEGPDIPCTNRAIIYNTFMIASLICETIKRFVMTEDIAREQIFDFVTRSWLVS